MANAQVAIDILARDRATATMERVGNAADKTGKKFGGLRKFAAGAGAAGALMALKFGKDSVEAFKDAEQSSAALDLALRKFPKTADVSRASLDKLNLAMSKKTVYDDDAFASGQAVLAQFNLTGKQIQRLTPLLADYATKTGKDLPSAATDLGRAFEGNTRALKALGINYKATGDKAADQAAITELLTAKVGGAAEAMGNTAAGKAAILGNQYGNLQEVVGSKLVPAMTKAAEIGLKVVDFISRNQAVIGPLVVVIGTLVAGYKIWTAAQALLNVVMTANPIGLVVLGIAALAAGLVVAYKRSETFREIVQGAMSGARSAFGWVIDRGKDLVGFFTSLPGRIVELGKGLVNIITAPYRTAFHWIAVAWNSTVGKLSFHAPDWIPKFGGKGWSMPKLPEDIPALAEGGIVTRPTVALIGEAGPEAVVPLGRSMGGGINVHVHVAGSVHAPRDLARLVRDALNDFRPPASWGGINYGTADF